MAYQETFRPLSNDQLHRAAPSIFAQEPAGGLSDKYRFVPTIDVIDALRNEGFLPVKVATSRSRTDGGVDYVKHTLRLRRESDLGIRLTNFDQVLPEIALTNSHNGTSGFILDAALHRLVCSNGLVVGRSQGSLRFRHTGRDDLIGRIIEGSYEIVNDFPAIADKAQQWRGVQLSDPQRLAFAKAALPLRFDAAEDGEYPVRPEQLLTYRRFGDNGKDLFTTFNVLQENLIRGGLSQGYTHGRRRQTTRKVGSVDRDLKLNRSLWVLADELAKVVQ